MVDPEKVHTLVISRTKLYEASQGRPMGAGVPVLGHLPQGAIVVSSFWDEATGDLHVAYRIAARPEPEVPPPDVTEVEGPGPILGPMMLPPAQRVIPLERIAMVAHEIIRCYHIATTGNPPAGWDELDQRDKLAEMGRCSLMRDENVTVSTLFANSNRIPDQHDRAIDRVENTLRACVVRAFNLTT